MKQLVLNENFILKILFFLLLIISFIKINYGTLFDVDEAIFAQTSKEMLETGDWITPHYNGKPRYDKPILIYWLIATNYKIFGINEFSVRLPSALAGALLCLVLYTFLKYLKNEIQALYAVISFAFTLYYFVYSYAGVTDMVLILFITLSLFSFYLTLEKNKKFLYGAYAFSAFAFLTKGLIGILFPFVIPVIYIFFKNLLNKKNLKLTLSESFKELKIIISVKCLLVFLLISMPWYLAETIIRGKEFIYEFFIKHHFLRYTKVIAGEKSPFYFFIPVLIIGMFPWIAFLFDGLKNFKKDSLYLFSFIWFLFIFIFFSFSETKLPNYILPSIPAICILISHGMYNLKKNFSRAPFILLSIFSLLFIILFFIIKLKAPQFFPQIELNWVNFLILIMIAFFLLSIYCIFVKRINYAGLTLLSFIFILVFTLEVLPCANKIYQGDLYRYSLYVKKNLKNNGILILYKLHKPSVLFYSGRKALYIRSPKKMHSFIKNTNTQVIVILKTKRLKTLGDLKKLNLKIIEKTKEYTLLQKD